MKRRGPSETSGRHLNDVDDGNNEEVPSPHCLFSGAILPDCLVRESRQMTPTRQVDARKDVLGISPVLDVSLEMIAQVWEHVHELEDKSGWDLAVQMDPQYAKSSERVMSFLRSVGGNPKQAARRLVRHFDTKLDLFGPTKLVKDIEISTDFSADDMAALESGGFQVLREKDRGGRPILFGRYTLMKYREIKNMVRALWYIWNSMVEDEEHQISGVVAIGFENGKLPLERFEHEEGSIFELHGSDGGFDRDLAREILRVPLSVPIRPMGYHICADNSRWQAIFEMIMVTICNFVKLRLRFHYGTHQEILYALMTHGIPVHTIPVKDSGDVDLSHHHAWIQDRLQLEQRRRETKQPPRLG